MKILLLGEYSGLHENLKDGLVKLGHDVIIASTGDGFKAVKSDIDLSSKANNIYLKKIIESIRLHKYMIKVKDFDVVHIISPLYIATPIDRLLKLKITPKKVMRRLKRYNKKVYISLAGSDYYVNQNSKNFRYHCYSDVNKIPLTSYYYKKINDIAVENANGLIPIMYEYSSAYKSHKNIMPTVPLSINLEKNKYIKNKVNNKIVIFHGLNREVQKGTKYIKEALEIIKSKYPDDVEVVVDGKMPLEQYLSLIKRTNIIIDQCKCYSYGMNALYSMAIGKVVFSGSEKECIDELDLKYCPIENITPEVNQIVEKLEKYIKNPSIIEEKGRLSRKFVEEYHDSKMIAQKYIDIFEKK